MAKETVENNDQAKMMLMALAVGIVGLVGLIFLFSGWYTIQSGQQGILLTWGAAGSGSVQPGFHLKWPIAQQIVKFDTRTQKLSQDASPDSYDSAASKDLQIVKVNVAVNYRLIQDKVPDIYTMVGPSYEDTVMIPTLHDALKAVTARYTAEELITRREEVRAGVQELLTEKMKQYYIIIEQVSIVKFDFSEQFNTAIEAKVTAEQNALAEQNKLQSIEFQAQQQVVAAEGARDAAIAQATGEAQKVKLVREQLSQSPSYIEYIKAQKWDGHLPVTFTGNGVQPFLNVAPFINTTG